MEQEEKSAEAIAKERVENSPLRYFTFRRFSGNHSDRTENSLPPSDRYVGRTPKLAFNYTGTDGI